MKKPIPKRFVSVRLSGPEFTEVYKHFEKSACASLTEYAKKLLTNKPVIIRIRDQSKDDLLESLINIKTKLSLLEDRLAENNLKALQETLNNIYNMLNNLYQLCTRM